MERLTIHLEDGSFNGSVIMSSPFSNFTAIRVSKKDVSAYASDLNGPGIYFLLVGKDSVYVGQSGLDTIKNRIMNSHSGTIDSDWHTVLAFVSKDKSITTNELLFVENAMTEFVHDVYSHCLTTTPSKANCNAMYRNEHYHLSASTRSICKQYAGDIRFYINRFPDGIFPQIDETSLIIDDPPLTHVMTFYFKNEKRDSEGKAVIAVHLGDKSTRSAILKAGSKISVQVSPKFASSASVITKREKAIAEGKIVNRILQEDIQFPSQSGAGEFLNGTSFDGNSKWKSVEGDIPLKELLE